MRLKVPVIWDGKNYTLECLINTPKFCALKNSPVRVLASDQSVQHFLGRNEDGGWEQVQLGSLNFFHGSLTISTSCSFSVNPKGLMAKLYVTIYFKRENLQVSSVSLFMGPFPWLYHGSFLDQRDVKSRSPRLCTASLLNIAYQGGPYSEHLMVAQSNQYNVGDAECPKSLFETPLIVSFPQRN